MSNSVYGIFFLTLHILVYKCLPACFFYVWTNAGTHGGPKRVSDALELGLTGSCGLPCGCWKPILSPLQEQEVLEWLNDLSSSLAYTSSFFKFHWLYTFGFILFFELTVTSCAKKMYLYPLPTGEGSCQWPLVPFSPVPWSTPLASFHISFVACERKVRF